MDTERGGQILDRLADPPAPHQLVDLVVGEASLGLTRLSPRRDLEGFIWRRFDFAIVRPSG
jgi:hypothetical protein